LSVGEKCIADVAGICGTQAGGAKEVEWADIFLGVEERLSFERSMEQERLLMLLSHIGTGGVLFAGLLGCG